METVFTNARLALEGEIRAGTLVVVDGRIARIDDGRSTVPGAIDCEGDLLLPGLIELHTDNLERHIQPRPGVDWPHGAAILAHDAELAGAGITTVFDAMRIGVIEGDEGAAVLQYARDLSREILALRSRAYCRKTRLISTSMRPRSRGVSAALSLAISPAGS